MSSAVRAPLAQAEPSCLAAPLQRQIPPGKTQMCVFVAPWKASRHRRAAVSPAAAPRDPQAGKPLTGHGPGRLGFPRPGCRAPNSRTKRRRAPGRGSGRWQRRRKGAQKPMGGGARPNPPPPFTPTPPFLWHRPLARSRRTGRRKGTPPKVLLCRHRCPRASPGLPPAAVNPPARNHFSACRSRDWGVQRSRTEIPAVLTRQKQQKKKLFQKNEPRQAGADGPVKPRPRLEPGASAAFAAAWKTEGEIPNPWCIPLPVGTGTQGSEHGNGIWLRERRRSGITTAARYGATGRAGDENTSQILRPSVAFERLPVAAPQVEGSQDRGPSEERSLPPADLLPPRCRGSPNPPIFHRTRHRSASETFIPNPAAAQGARERAGPKLETPTRLGDAVPPADTPGRPARPPAPLVGSQGCESAHEAYGRAASAPPARLAGKHSTHRAPQDPAEGRALLRCRSPAHHAGASKSPTEPSRPTVPSAGASPPVPRTHNRPWPRCCSGTANASTPGELNRRQCVRPRYRAATPGCTWVPRQRILARRVVRPPAAISRGTRELHPAKPAQPFPNRRNTKPFQKPQTPKSTASGRGSPQSRRAAASRSAASLSFRLNYGI